MRVLTVAVAVVLCCSGQSRALPIPEVGGIDESVGLEASATPVHDDIPAVARIPPPGVKLAIPKAGKSIVTVQAEGNVAVDSKGGQIASTKLTTVHKLVPIPVVGNEENAPVGLSNPDDQQVSGVAGLETDKQMPLGISEAKDEELTATMEAQEEISAVQLKDTDLMLDVRANTEEQVPEIMVETEEKMAAAEPIPASPTITMTAEDVMPSPAMESETPMGAEPVPAFPTITMKAEEPMPSPAMESEQAMDTPVLLTIEAVTNELQLASPPAPVTAVEIVPPIASVPIMESATHVLSPVPAEAGIPIVPSSPLLSPAAPGPIMAQPLPSVLVVEAPEPRMAPEPPMPSVGVPYVGGQFHAQDEAGQFTFGYWGGPNTRVETRDSLGRTSGSFAYVNPDGDVQIRKYSAAPTMGFKVAASDLPVDTNVAPQDTLAVAQVKAAHARLFAAIADMNREMELTEV